MELGGLKMIELPDIMDNKKALNMNQTNKIDKNIPGIYFIYDKRDKVVYIGQSYDVKSRLKAHFRGQTNTREHSGLFKAFKYVKVEGCAARTIYEVYYINKLKPKCNKQFIYKGRVNASKNPLQINAEISPVTIMQNLTKEIGLLQSENRKMSKTIKELELTLFEKDLYSKYAVDKKEEELYYKQTELEHIKKQFETLICKNNKSFNYRILKFFSRGMWLQRWVKLNRFFRFLHKEESPCTQLD